MFVFFSCFPFFPYFLMIECNLPFLPGYVIPKIRQSGGIQTIFEKTDLTIAGAFHFCSKLQQQSRKLLHGCVEQRRRARSA